MLPKFADGVLMVDVGFGQGVAAVLLALIVESSLAVFGVASSVKVALPVCIDLESNPAALKVVFCYFGVDCGLELAYGDDGLEIRGNR